MHARKNKGFGIPLLLMSSLFAVAAAEATETGLPRQDIASREMPERSTFVASVIPKAVTSREYVPTSRSPYTAVGHFNLEGQRSATLWFGPSSSQIVITSAHVFNTIIFGLDRYASYSDDHGNTANIVAVYLPKDYDARSPIAEGANGKFFDKAIVVLDRSIPGATHLPFNLFKVTEHLPCHYDKYGEGDCTLTKSLPIDQAGYPYDRPFLSANIGGIIDGITIRSGHPATYLLHHTLNITPGDSGSMVLDDDGVVGITQSNQYATPLTQPFIDCYNKVVQEVGAHPPKPLPPGALAPIGFIRAEM